MAKTYKKSPKQKRNRTFKNKDFISGDGMLTTVWGPSIWHFLHILSFNYPIHPTKEDKIHYKKFIINLQTILPCKYCRTNLKNNFKILPLQACNLKNRDSFSRYIYQLHEVINKMLGKKSGLSYCDVRERYEHFRSRCTQEKPKLVKLPKTRKIKKEKGCTEPLYGKKAKCIIKIVPQNEKCPSFQMDQKCVKTKI